jgi:DNA-binding winged helix-turn-helix (wHTH) protein
VERPGELVGKRELVAVVWPDTIVVEANLKVQVAALRRLVARMTATVQLDPQPEPSAR